MGGGEEQVQGEGEGGEEAEKEAGGGVRVGGAREGREVEGIGGG